MEDIDDFVLLYLRHNFDGSAAAAPRNSDSENLMIRRCKLELKLACTLFDEVALAKWLPNTRQGENFKGSDHNEYMIKDWSHIYINGKLFRATADANYVSVPLIEFYARIHKLSIGEAEKKLLMIFPVSDGFWDDIHPNSPYVSRLPAIPTKCYYSELPFYDSTNSFVVGRLGAVDSLADKRLLPISHLYHCNSWHYLYIPFDEQIIYNYEILKRKKSTSVILTDSIKTAYSNQLKIRELLGLDIVFVSWLDGIEGLCKLDINHFKGRNVYYLVFNHSGLSIQETYRNTLKVVEKFAQENVLLKLVSFLNDVPITSSIGYFLGTPRIVTKHALCFETKAKPRTSEYKLLTLFQANPISSALLTPIIMPREITLFLGAPLSNNTVLTTAMSWAISQGSGLFKQWRAPAPRGVLYILGEQPERSLWQTMSIHFKTHAKGNKEILEKHIPPDQFSHIPQGVSALLGDLQAQPYPAPPKGLTVDSPIGKKIRYNQFWGISAASQDSNFKIDDWIAYTNRQLHLLRQKGVNISLIVLDHLLAFQSLFCNPSEVNKLNDWLMTMQFEGYAIWIIPPGRVDDRSSNRLLNSVRINNCIHVNKIKSVAPSDVTMSIEIEQTCKALEKQEKKFSMTINPFASCPVWHSVETGLTRSKKKSIVNKLLALGKNGPQIALETGFSLSSVKDLKRALELSKKTPSKAPHKKPKDTQYHYNP